MIVLRADKLNLGYNGASVVKNMSVEIPRGKIVGIIGPNGSGKSTLLRALAGLHKPFSGTSYLREKDIRSFTAQQRARMIGWVPQRQTYIWPLTVQDTVNLGRAPHRGWFLPLSSKDHQVVDQMLNMTELSTLKYRRIDRLSGGEFQRAMIARALVQEPEILLLDEPTANLDIHHQIQVFDMIQTLVNQGELTAVVAIHDLSLAARYCEQFILLHHGECYSKGGPQDVLTSENILEVFGVEARLYRDPWNYWALTIKNGVNQHE